MNMEQVYFLTVAEGSMRGIFCNDKGHCFHKKGGPHTVLEIQEFLGPFWRILTPRSEVFTEKQLSEFTFWFPLGEYRDQFGIAVKQCDVPVSRKGVYWASTIVMSDGSLGNITHSWTEFTPSVPEDLEE